MSNELPEGEIGEVLLDRQQFVVHELVLDGPLLVLVHVHVHVPDQLKLNM